MKHLTSSTNGSSRSIAEPRAAICVTRRFNVSPERVFNAWLDPEVAGQWLFATALRPMTDVEIDPRVGGSFRLAERWDGEVVEHAGEYVEIVPNRRLVFILSRADRPRAITRVTVAVTPLRAGCELALTHEQMPAVDANYVEGRWTGILYGVGRRARFEDRSMKYLCLAYYDVQKFDALSPTELDAIVGQCPAYDETLRQSGQLLVQASLGSASASISVRPRNGKLTVTDGPFIETKEQVGGFFIIEARDLNEAIRVASKHPAANLGERVGWGIEVRPIEGYDARTWQST